MMKNTCFFTVLMLSMVVFVGAQTTPYLPKDLLQSEKGLHPNEEAFCSLCDIKQAFNHEHLKNDNPEWLLDSVIRYDFRSAPDSVLQNKQIYNYDAQGNITLQVHSNWDSENEVWVPTFKHEYEYDAQGNLTLRVQSNWNSENEDWVIVLKQEYEYDAQGNLTLLVRYNWDSENEVWVTVFKYEYEYDAQGNQTLMVFYSWDGENEVWVTFSKREYEYDAQGNLTLWVAYNWDSENEVWVPHLKHEYEYDAQGNLTLLVRFNWDNENEVWVNNWKHKYEYDAQGNWTLAEDYIWDDVLGDWIIQYKAFRYFSEFIVGIPFTQDNQIIVYPNPIQDFLYLKGVTNAHIKIFDISGRLILSRSNTNAIDLSGLSTGVYVIKVSDSHNSLIQRFIKQ